MRTHTWARICVGLVIVLVAAMPALAAGESGPAETAAADPATPPAPVMTTPRSKWAAPTVQFGGYAAYATLQALDVVSTLRALKTPGAYEANPMYAGVVDSPAKFIALKSASTLATILFMQKFSKNHPKAAVFVMAGLNSGYLFVVNNNFNRATR